VERDLMSQTGVSEAFWGAIGYKVNDIPCSHFCAEADANQKQQTNVLQPTRDIRQGHLRF
jgi:hypothetical protein